MAYQQYSGYDENTVKRQMALAQAMYARAMEDSGPVQSVTQGLARLAKAHFGREGLIRAQEAEKGLTEGKKSVAEALFNASFPGDVSTSAYPDQFTPEQQESGQANAQARALADLTGDPAGAVAGVRDQQQKDVANALARRKLELEENKPIVAGPGSVGYAPNGFGGVNEIFSVPDTAAGGAGGRVHSAFITPENVVTALMNDGSSKKTDITAAEPLRTFTAGDVPYLYGSRGGAAPSPAVTAAQAAQNAGTVKAGEKLGETQAKAIATAPETIATADRAIASINELINSPGMKWAYGLGRLNPIEGMAPGSDRKNTEAIRGKLDGQFFVNAITGMQVSLAPVSDADALRLVASISQLTNPEISEQEARRVAGELKQYFEAAKKKAQVAQTRGPVTTAGVEQVTQRKRVRDKAGNEFDVELRNGKWERAQ